MWTQSCPVVVEAEIGEMHLQVQEREAPRPQGAQPCRPRSRTSGLQNRERHISAVLSHSACGPVTATTGSEDPQRSPCRRGWGAARVRPVSQSSAPRTPRPRKGDGGRDPEA